MSLPLGSTTYFHQYQSCSLCIAWYRWIRLHVSVGISIIQSLAFVTHTQRAQAPFCIQGWIVRVDLQCLQRKDDFRLKNKPVTKWHCLLTTHANMCSVDMATFLSCETYVCLLFAVTHNTCKYAFCGYLSCETICTFQSRTKTSVHKKIKIKVNHIVKCYVYWIIRIHMI
jgi:hypothetical protein